jgi:hypothetical protein
MALGLEVLGFIIVIFDSLGVKYRDVFTTSVNRAMEEEVVQSVQVMGNSKDSE